MPITASLTSSRYDIKVKRLRFFEREERMICIPGFPSPRRPGSVRESFLIQSSKYAFLRFCGSLLRPDAVQDLLGIQLGLQ